jgi:hypothetical protein
MTAGDRARVRRIADGIVAAHAGYRRRVRWAIAAGAAVAVITALPSLLVLHRHDETAAALGGSAPTGALPAVMTRTPTSVAPHTYESPAFQSAGEGGATDFASALRRWRPRGVIRVYRPSTTPVQRAELRTMLGSRVRFVGTRVGAAVLHRSGTISFPRASSVRGSNS